MPSSLGRLEHLTTCCPVVATAFTPTCVTPYFSLGLPRSVACPHGLLTSPHTSTCPNRPSPKTAELRAGVTVEDPRKGEQVILDTAPSLGPWDRHEECPPPCNLARVTRLLRQVPSLQYQQRNTERMPRAQAGAGTWAPLLQGRSGERVEYPQVSGLQSPTDHTQPCHPS